jgi:hypothetical protein
MGLFVDSENTFDVTVYYVFDKTRRRLPCLIACLPPARKQFH